MNRLVVIIAIVLTGGTLSSALSAQDNRERNPDFEYIRHSDPWLTGYNAAGLYLLPLDDISVAEVSFDKSNGKFVNYYQSDNSFTLGGKAESFYRLSPKAVMYGMVSYENFQGRNMGGSAFINPYYNPFDIVEHADTNIGKKQMEHYHLIGAASIDLYKGLKLGGKIDYLAANYAKFKDLRHKNKLLDMSLTVGLSYPVNSFLEVGANYFYRRSTEGIVFHAYGNTDRQYYSLINFGAFFGRREILGNTGYTRDNENNPLFNEFHGGSLQLQLFFSPQITFFNEFTYKKRDGYFGKRSPNTIVYSNHNSGIMEYSGRFSLLSGKNRHSIAFSAANEELENHENIYKIENNEGNNNDVVYYGKNKMLDKKTLTAQLEYTGNLNVVDFNPLWVLKAVAGFSQRQQTTSVYPYYRKQTVRVFDANLSANRNIFAEGQVFSIGLNTGFNAGSGTDKNDGMYTSNSDDGANPSSLDASLYREYEYLTASHIKAGAAFRYARPINQDVSAYVAINYQFIKALDIKHLPGDTFGSFTIKFGCEF